MKFLRKQHIINVAVDLFADEGINNVSVEKIAQEVGASRGKIYYYFKEGKNDIIASILLMFEECVSKKIPHPEECESEDVNAEHILSKLLFQFPNEDTIRYRKMLRIILSEMFSNKQVREYILNDFIVGREQTLSKCFQSLSYNEKIVPLDADSVARFLNRLLFVYAVIEALDYPDEQAGQLEMMMRDCANFIEYILTWK